MRSRRSSSPSSSSRASSSGRRAAGSSPARPSGISGLPSRPALPRRLVYSPMTVKSDWPDLAGRLVDGGHVLPIRIYFEDTDFSGVVYHAAFLRFMERGRSDMIRLMGVNHEALAK